MRCPECKQVTRGRVTACGNCGYRFVFTSQTDVLRDYRFRQLVDKLGGQGQFGFSSNQLAMEICRATAQGNAWIMVAMVVVAVVALIVGFNASGVGLFIAWVLLASVGLWLLQRRQALRDQQRRADFANARALIGRYRVAHEIRGLATGRAYEDSPAEMPQELRDYPPERILVVPRNDLVDALVASGVHRSQKTAIVSAHGYPQKVLMACRYFVDKQADLPVYVAHDDSPAGRRLVEDLRQDQAFAFARDRLVDIGYGDQSFADTDHALPWVMPDGRVIWSGKAQVQRGKGGVLWFDFARPADLHNLLGAALLSGGMMALGALAPGAASGDSSGGDFG
jgi:hypothetical protein